MKIFLLRLWSKRLIRWPVWTLITLATLLLLAVQIASYVGNRDWTAINASLAKEGETLDFRKITPAPVPDDQNFCSIASLRDINSEPRGRAARDALSVFDLRKLAEGEKLPSLDTGISTGQPADISAWTHAITHKANGTADDLLSALNAQQPVVTEMVTSLQRPHARWTPQWHERELPDLLYTVPLPHYGPTRNIVRSLALRSIVAAQSGKADEAHSSARIITRLAEANAHDPFLIGLLVAVTDALQAAECTWHLCAAQKGSTEDFARLQQDLQRLDFTAASLLAWRGELAAGTSSIDYLARADSSARKQLKSLGSEHEVIDLLKLPSGLLRMNAATVAVLQWNYCLKPLKDEGLIALQKSGAELTEKLQRMRADFYLHPGYLLAGITIPATTKVNESVIYASVVVQQAVIACALERYRLEHSQYPAALQDLGKLNIIDIWSGKPMLYSRTANGRYKLWSVGPDKADDGGRRDLAKTQSTPPKFRDSSYKGDWVWEYAETKAK